ncbi:TIGR01777 family oxidoreductase [Roseateles koreensis]|uniref:TIGR01777 family oxidoreductase n=1 Tax=Roseateles koreensis TaxID=2987526 RepID=A0ABT5KNA5_9BURK|nr:TIGR01777 family oxidoreductase [Roseateles koreensis]MDC8784395.1 TIGR01777 family oxidoreductase [Roseateles koreensis]
MRILMTGGTGLIGRALCELWTSHGHELLVLSRHPERVAGRCFGARGLSMLQELDDIGPVDAVVNLAGAPIADKPWSASRRDLLWQSRIDSTRRLVQWIAQQPRRPALLLSASAVGWYGNAGERVLNEASSPGSVDFGTQLCEAWELEALQATTSGTRVVRLRIAPVLAPGAGLLARLRTPYRLGLGGRMGNGRQWMPWIHQQDLIRMVDWLLQNPSCEGVYNACAPEPVRQATFAKALAHAWHRPALLSTPAWVLRAALGEMSVLLLSSQCLRPHRAMNAGFSFDYPAIDLAVTNLIKPQS